MVQAKPHPPSLNGNSQQIAFSESQQIIQFNHPEKYRTSEWYTGQGEIAASGDSRSFSVSATYTLKAEVKLVDGVFNPDNLTLAEIYSRRGRCVAIVDKTVDELYEVAIAQFNRFVAEEPRVEQVLLPLRDGLTIIRRK